MKSFTDLIRNVYKIKTWLCKRRMLELCKHENDSLNVKLSKVAGKAVKREEIDALCQAIKVSFSEMKNPTLRLVMSLVYCFIKKSICFLEFRDDEWENWNLVFPKEMNINNFILENPRSTAGYLIFSLTSEGLNLHNGSRWLLVTLSKFKSSWFFISELKRYLLLFLLVHH